ncbi:MAG: hypothetical protein BGO69_07870 [Bacteroidetes bacterium 46-16]|nr:MAG: hypothetical protein BGO69_07870 [Bacteroidetes bacterium 46-16]
MMDQNESKIFSLEVDDIAKSHMLEMGRWGKFLSIVGFIMIGLMILVGLFSSVALSAVTASSLLGGITGMGLFLIYLIMGAILFYPTFSLFRFATNIKPALNTMNREQFNTAFANLKSMFKYWGIMMIIILSLYGIVILFAIVGLAS